MNSIKNNMFELLRRTLIELGIGENWSEESAIVEYTGIDMMLLKESLISIGGIIIYDNGNQVIAKVRSGWANLGTAYLACSICDNSIFILAKSKEGILKQGLSKKALAKITGFFARNFKLS